MFYKSIHFLLVIFLISAVMPALAQYYVGRYQNVTGESLPVRCAQCHIITYSQDPDLHGGLFSRVFAGVFTTDGERDYWARTGYTFRTDQTSEEIFFEYRRGAPTYAIIHEEDTPLGTGEHNCKVVQDEETGVWTAYYDGTSWKSSTGNTNWAGYKAEYCGQVNYDTVQLMGDDNERISFRLFRYKDSAGNWTDPPIWPSSNYDHDTNLWERLDLAANKMFYIWDKNP